MFDIVSFLKYHPELDLYVQQVVMDLCNLPELMVVVRVVNWWAAQSASEGVGRCRCTILGCAGLSYNITVSDLKISLSAVSGCLLSC